MDELTPMASRAASGGYQAVILHRRAFTGHACEYHQQIRNTFETEAEALAAAESIIVRLMDSACHERRSVPRFS
ncbi:hypothetical protein [Chitinimonas sp. BJYL2]|uniref:hypothetical protein n=1 Tax=Chitinimonas sp. BJYL2 TaxID=2976696 RepID=UPI0022B40A99|nr:hypothetical protein [Chitinimonas sp. BJYL2]